MTTQSAAKVRSRRSREPDRHHAAIVAAELRRVERQLRATGPMPRTALVQACGEARWREGNVIEAIQEGLRQHRLRKLPLGWVTIER